MAKNFLRLKSLGARLFFLTIPKPLKQYTLLKKDYPFRYYFSVYNKNTPNFKLTDLLRMV